MTNSVGHRALAAVAAIIALSTPAWADYVSGLDPEGKGFLALRRGPGANFAPIGELYPNTVVDVLDQDGPWKYIQLENGKAGWAHGSSISPGLPPFEGDEEAAPDQAGNEAAITVPMPGSPERQEILDTARAAAETDVGFSVGLRSHTLRMFGDWAYVQGVPTAPDGKAVDWRTTRYGDVIRDGFASDVVMVLMRREDAGWAIAESIFGPTDVYWYGWLDKYGLPERLFFSEEQLGYPEDDWAGPASGISGGTSPDTPMSAGPEVPPAWRDPVFGFSLALPGDWRTQISDENGMHLVASLSPRDEAAVVVIAMNTGRKLTPDQLVATFEPLLTQNIITKARSLSKAPRTINGLDGISARYSGIYASDTGPLPSTGEAFYTSTETAGFIVLTIVPDFLEERWQQVLAAILDSFGFPAASGTSGNAAVPQTTPEPSHFTPGPEAGLSVETVQARLPTRPDGLPWGLAFSRDASAETAGQAPDVTARFMAFAPDGAEPFESDIDLLVFEGPGERLDALFAEYRTAPGAKPLAFASHGVEIDAGGTEIWLRRQTELIRITSPDRALALAMAQSIAP